MKCSVNVNNICVHFNYLAVLEILYLFIVFPCVLCGVSRVADSVGLNGDIV